MCLNKEEFELGEVGDSNKARKGDLVVMIEKE